MSLRKHNPRRIKLSREKFSRILNCHSCKCSNGPRLKCKNQIKYQILVLKFIIIRLSYTITNENTRYEMWNDFYQISSTSGSDIRIACKSNDQTERNCDSYEQTKEETHFCSHFFSKDLTRNERDTMILDRIHSSEQRVLCFEIN